MANHIRLKRGLAANRTGFIPREGEPLYDTDTKKTYIGDGSTAGGVPVDGGGGGGRYATVSIAASNALHPEQYDVQCDGVDDHIKINAALLNKGLVFLSDGQFNVTRPIIMYKDTILTGTGQKTIIKAAVGFDNPFESTNGMIENSDAYSGLDKNMSVTNLQLDGNSSVVVEVSGIHMNFVENVWINNIYVKNCNQLGIFFAQGNTFVDSSKRIRITNCFAEDCLPNGLGGNDFGTGIGITSMDIMMSNCAVKNSAIGFAFEGGQSILISNIYAEYCTRFGIDIRNNHTLYWLMSNSRASNNGVGFKIWGGAKRGSLSNCYANGNATYGIELGEPADNILVTGCSAYNNAIGIYSSYSPTIRGNHVYGNTGYGIYFIAGKCKIIGNDIYENGSAGIGGVNASNETFIADNHIYNNNQSSGIGIAHAGIALFDGNTPIIQNNTVEGTSHDYAIASNTCTNVRLVDNTLGRGVTGTIFNTGNFNLIFSSVCDRFPTCAAGAFEYIMPLTAGDGTDKEVTTGLTNPDVARTLSVTSTDIASPSGNVSVEGINARGETASEAHAINPGSSVEYDLPFLTVTKVIIPSGVSSSDQIAVGIHTRLGVSIPIFMNTDIIKTIKNGTEEPTGTIDLPNGTINKHGLIANDDYLIYIKKNSNTFWG